MLFYVCTTKVTKAEGQTKGGNNKLDKYFTSSQLEPLVAKIQIDSIPVKQLHRQLPILWIFGRTPLRIFMII